jgi:ribosomal protein L3 glutamine methyltransferase
MPNQLFIDTPLINEAASHFRTLRDFIRFAVTQMTQAKVSFGQGTDNAFDEAAYLTLHTLNLPIDQLDPFLDAVLLPVERLMVLNVLAKRVNERLPAAYITGEAWLQGYRFTVDKNVIIPRSPIAELLVSQLDTWVDEPHDIKHVLDVCTGSGCLAILAALVLPNAQVDATDISEEALSIAKANVNDYNLSARVHLHQGSLLEPLPTKHHYNMIICNPPYVNDASMQALPPEFMHEPSLALAGGVNGMRLVSDLLNQCAKKLTSDGILFLEIGHERAHFDAAFKHLSPTWIDTLGTQDQIMMLTAAQLQS